MTEQILARNLSNVGVDIDLFGNEHKRLAMNDRIGFLPISVWKPNWETVKELKDIIGDSGDTRKLLGEKMDFLGSKFTTSIFNPHLAQMILSAYCPPKARIFDAFAGGGTRGFIASAMGHTYEGVELRQEEVDRILAKQAELVEPFKIECADSRTYPVEAGTFDFSYSCPPYYNLETYSKEAGDLSNAGTYDEFRQMLKECLRTSYNALKPGALCVWVVGNFRNKKGELVHFNGDTVRLAQEVGFSLWDELVFWGASDLAMSRSGMFGHNRKSVRVHEYILIFKKPN